MRSLVIDFDLTILWPLFLFALIVLGNSIYTYFRPNEERQYWRPSESRSTLELGDSDARRKVNDARWDLRDAEWELSQIDWEERRREEKNKAKNLIWFSAAALCVLCASMLLNDRWKMNIAYQIWASLKFISGMAFVFAIIAAWHYARNGNRLKLGMCALAMLLAAASAEHFFHQSINARHVACPHCSSDDQSDDT